MSSFKRYDTRTQATAGVILQLLGPDGKPSGDWVRVRGGDAPEFQRADREFRRELLDYINGHPPEFRKTAEYRDHVDLHHVKLQAHLVMEWSFDEPCTVDNVLACFTIAPDIAKQVDEFSGKRERFAGNWSTPSEPLQSNSSASVSQ